ncbi:MAG: hypothetical protein FWG32_07615, partial [Oscillospiraceae bacterium]|nr:hypothetical protein [Oscillospiraceae bacterium]
MYALFRNTIVRYCMYYFNLFGVGSDRPLKHSLRYYLSPVVSTLNPRKNKNRYRAAILRQKLEQADTLPLEFWNDKREREKAREVCADMTDGKPVT